MINDVMQKLINNYISRSTKNDTNAIKRPLRDVKVNDTLKVEVLNVKSDGILVKLDDGSELKIAGIIPKEVKEGNILEILITGKSSHQAITAEILSISKMVDEMKTEIDAMLKKLGITSTNENLDIISEMYKNNIEINEENVKKVFDTLKEYASSKENIMFLIKNDIEVTKESIRSFDSMINKRDFLEDNLKVLIELIDIAIDEVIEKGKKIEINTIEKNDIISKELQEKLNYDVLLEEKDALKNEVVNEMKKTSILEKSNIQPENDFVESDILIKNDTLEKDVNNVDKLNFNNEADVENEQKYQNESLEDNVELKNQEELKQIEIKKENVENTQGISKDVENNNSIINQNEEIINLSKKENTLVNNLNEDEVVNVKDKNPENITQDKKNVSINKTHLENDEVLENLIGNSSKMEELNEFEINSKEGKLNKLREEIINVFKEVRKSKDLGEEISFRRVVKSFKDVIENIENNIESFKKESANLVLKETLKMKENLELVTNLNQYNTVIHIPLLINNSKTVAELYVFNDDIENSKKKINENNATMFLTLGTANLGQIEAYIKVVNKTIECNFMSESNLGTNLINENKSHLSKLLELYGYTLIKANAETYKGKAINIFEAIEKNKRDEIKKGFDARA